MTGLPALLLYGFFLVIRSFFGKHKNISLGVVIVFMMVTIIYRAFISLFSFGEQNRHRFLVDSFYLVLLGMFIEDALNAGDSFFRRFLSRVRGENV